jgi:hypothetical protein
MDREHDRSTTENDAPSANVGPEDSVEEERVDVRTSRARRDLVGERVHGARAVEPEAWTNGRLEPERERDAGTWVVDRAAAIRHGGLDVGRLGGNLTAHRALGDPNGDLARRRIRVESRVLERGVRARSEGLPEVDLSMKDVHVDGTAGAIAAHENLARFANERDFHRKSRMRDECLSPMPTSERGERGGELRRRGRLDRGVTAEEGRPKLVTDGIGGSGTGRGTNGMTVFSRQIHARGRARFFFVVRVRVVALSTRRIALRERNGRRLVAVGSKKRNAAAILTGHVS